MPTNFPTSLDDFPASSVLHGLNQDGTAASPVPSGTHHSSLLGDIGLALEALEAKVGVDSSAVTSSLDYKVTNRQPLDSDLTSIAGLTPSNDDIIQRKAGAWANRTLAQLMTDLAALGTTFQPLDADLTSIAALSTTSFGRSLLTMADAAAALNALTLAINAQTVTTYTTVLTDAQKIITSSNTSAQTITIPLNSSVAYPVGTVLTIVQKNTGQVTIAATGGVTINTPSTLKTRTQYSIISLYKDGTDVWTAYGDLEPLGQTINDQTGTTYGFVLADANTMVTSSNGSAQTLTIPANASVAFPIGTIINLMQLGTGQVTVAITSDTLRSTPTAKLRTQYSVGFIQKIAATTWVLGGDLAAT